MCIRDRITGGKYKRVLLTENFEIYLDTGEKYLQLYQVSYGTVEQVYLALRLACGEILCQEAVSYTHLDVYKRQECS